ncbi:MAG: hypothetical protein ACRDPS_09645 [Nocardioides sp.]|uniref:hypothetical protein n=1 Tax=Nocardioides sp. TaxID=35761 RepID=UPI003D6AB2DA
MGEYGTSCDFEEHPAGCQCLDMSMKDLVMSGDDRDWPKGGDEWFRTDWRAEMLALDPRGAVLRKAWGFCVFYFDSGKPTMTLAAAAYGIKRDTGAAHMQRCHDEGWIVAHGSPFQIGKKTARRIYSRRMFWDAPEFVAESRPGGQFGRWLEPYGDLLEVAPVVYIFSGEIAA